MQFRSLFKPVILSAGIVIFSVGLALAQTAPAPTPAAPQTNAAPGGGAMKEAREACRNEVSKDIKGEDRREAMKKCMQTKRQAAGLPSKEDRKAKMQENREACRTEIGKDAKGDERRAKMQDCIAKKDPQQAKVAACRKEASDKKVEPRTKEFREAMRACMTRG